MSKHTPGPWKIRKINNHELTIDGKTCFDLSSVYVNNGDKGEGIHNAQLIASAPELLLAAKEAALLLKEIADMCKVNCLKSPGFLNLMEAIKKAEGK